MKVPNDKTDNLRLETTAVGVDPGSRITGIGIVQRNGTRLLHIDHFPIRIPEKLDPASKLVCFANQFDTVISRFPSAALVIESLFTAKNVRSILTLSHVRGVAMMMAARAGWSVNEIAPASIKLNIAGYGRATKQQIQYMIQKMLQLDKPPSPEDCSDALAMAVCYLNQTRLLQRMKRQI